jgi:hypothetical protein
VRRVHAVHEKVNDVEEERQDWKEHEDLELECEDVLD